MSPDPRKSLVYCQSSGAQPRFNLYESIAAFARKQPDASPGAGRPEHRHARFHAAACQAEMVQREWALLCQTWKERGRQVAEDAFPLEHLGCFA